MSSKSQQEYINQFKETLYEYGTDYEDKAYKLLYQWVKTGCIKQTTFIELLRYIRWEE